MPSDSPPARFVRDPRVSAGLRAARAELGITGDVVAAGLRWSTSKISRYELGRSSLRVTTVKRLLDYYVTRGLDPVRAESLMTLARQDAAMPPPDERLAGADMASAVLEWAPLTVPKLLQVPGYTDAVLAARQQVLQISPGAARDAAGAVWQWQERLTADPPLQLRAVLDESVLYRLAGDTALMRYQLRHLDKIPNQAGTDVRIRVLPRDCGVPVPVGPFAYLQYPARHGVAAQAAVLEDDQDGLRVLPLAEESVWRRSLAFHQLWGLAAAPGPLIKRALAEAWPGTA